MSTPSDRNRLWRTLTVLVVAGALALSAYSVSQVARDRPATRPPAPPADGARFHVLMINGGGTQAHNYQSHLLHVRQLVDLLRRAGVAPEQIAIFSADGPDAAADLAMREVQPEANFWLLGGTSVERFLRTPITYGNSEIPDMRLEAATTAGINAWFDAASYRLHSGDTLLLYVTDHGTKNPEDASNNKITLWGKDESLTVQALRQLLGKLDPGVRVVTLMSQCYSGGFAHLMDGPAADSAPSGAVCGYFSSTADRRAYGCYPENRGVENVGHSFHFIQALASTGSFAAAHDRVLVTDATPDVPLRTSDVYLEELLRRTARTDGRELSALVDALLHEAWQHKAAWEPEIRLLDRIGVAFGCFSPRSLAELEEQTKDLPDISEQLGKVARSWKASLEDATQANLDRFLTAHSDWAGRVRPQALTGIEAAAARGLTAELLAELGPFAAADQAGDTRLHVLKDEGDAAAAANYRMEVRLGVVLRMRAILTSIAGRVYLATGAMPAERAAYDALAACEQLTLPAPPPSGGATLAAAAPFPPFDEDVQRAQAALPGWMGIQFRQAAAEQRTKLELRDGASTVMTVYPDSPAAAAGLQSGDIIVGPPNQPFSERNEVRAWTMLSKIDEPRPLDVVRGGEHMQLTLVPKPYPMKWPALPGPPKISSVAPSLSVSPYRGILPVALNDGTPHLLFFWATWCAPCKAALPEVVEFERQRHTPVIAITDELPEQLDMFFKTFTEPFPEIVAVDEYRRAFVAYGVSGTPTIFLVDGSGTVQSYSTGYSPEKSLGVPGWSWTARTPQSAP